MAASFANCARLVASIGVRQMSSKKSLVETFNTHNVDDRTLISIGTAREAEKRELTNIIRRSCGACPGNLQHAVVYGPWGFGKSFLMRLMQRRTQRFDGVMSAVSNSKQSHKGADFVLLPEEQKKPVSQPPRFARFHSSRARRPSNRRKKPATKRRCFNGPMKRR